LICLKKLSSIKISGTNYRIQSLQPAEIPGIGVISFGSNEAKNFRSLNSEIEA